MGVLKIAAIVLFALAGGAFLFSWIYFFSKNVAADIRFLRKIDENAESGEHRDFSGVSFAKAFEQEKTPSKRNTSSGKEIVAASLTVDEGEPEEIVPAGSETLDWTLPEGAEFLLTKDITVYHSNKEYLIRE
ncbi:MAG: hypothetical protein IJL32_05725 [Oscillospiraceae bacterium]|nr:hypothetical protein [Oscillospiraceae bacterium]